MPVSAGARVDGPHPAPDGAPSPSYPGPHPGRAEAWAALGANPWVFSTMTQGYRLQFSRKPTLSISGPQHAMQNKRHRRILEEEVATLLSKGAIREVGKADHQSGFFSRYFLIPKRDGGLRPVLDLRGLNWFLRPLRCRMLTVPRVC